jgi:hypothetical protein
MSHPMYALLTNIPFRVPLNPGDAADYTRPVVPGQQPDLTPLTRTEQALINTTFARCKHYFLLVENIKQACFNVLDSSIKDAFKVSNNPTIQGWHAGMTICNILDQSLLIYGQPTAHPSSNGTQRCDIPWPIFCCQCTLSSFLLNQELR